MNSGDVSSGSSEVPPTHLDDGDNDDGTINVSGKHKELYKTLLRTFNSISKTSNKNLDYDALAVVNVAPSVVPNPYLPSFRVFAYNLTGTEYVPASMDDKEDDVGVGYSIDEDEGEDADDDEEEDLEVSDVDEGEGEDEDDWIRDAFTSDEREEEEEEDGGEVEVGRHLGDYVDRESWCPGGKRSWACLLTDKWHSSPRSPSRANKLFTPIGFAQVSVALFAWIEMRSVRLRYRCRVDVSGWVVVDWWMFSGSGGGRRARELDTFNCKFCL